MNGTVTMSIEDYELLKNQARENQSSILMHHNDVLQKIKEGLNGCAVERTQYGYNSYTYYIEESAAKIFKRMSVAQFIKWKKTKATTL